MFEVKGERRIGFDSDDILEIVKERIKDDPYDMLDGYTSEDFVSNDIKEISWDEANEAIIVVIET